MTEMDVADVKRRFAELIDRVRAGERILVTRGGRLVMALVPPAPVEAGSTTGPMTGFAALAGALADVDGFGESMDEVVASRRELPLDAR